MPAGRSPIQVSWGFPVLKVSVVSYSGLKNCCNVLQFWSGCDVALDRVRLMLSVGEIK